MDVKLLLLKSLSLKKPISGTHRIYYEKLCFVIKYEINGKVLSIKSIKSNKKCTTWTERIKYYNRVYKLHRIRNRNLRNTQKLLVRQICSFKDKETITDNFCGHTQSTQTETFEIRSTKNIEMSSQTIDVQKYTKEVQTEKLMTSIKVKESSKLGSTQKIDSIIQNQAISFTTTAQQTIACAKFIRNMAFVNQKLPARNSSKSSQTDSNTECRGIQCKRTAQTKATNTDTNTRDSSTQAQNNEMLGVLSPAQHTQILPLPVKDFEVFIYMLNEIGETVVNQNQILTNNNEIMKQIMQTNNKQIDAECGHHSCSSISTQTEQLLKIEVKHNFTQTEENSTKPRKLLLFKGRNNQQQNK